MPRQGHGYGARRATTRADRSGTDSVVEVLLGVHRLVDHLVVGLVGGAGQVGGVDGSVRDVLHGEAAVLIGASGSALLVVLGLLGRLI